MKLKLTITILFIALLLVGCGGGASTPPSGPTPDVAAVRTSAAGTVVSQFTLTAAAFTPTTSLPTNTTAPDATATATLPVLAQVTNLSGTPEALCDSLEFVADVNVPDNTPMTPGQDFIKTWKVRNNGSCEWGPGYVLAYAEYTDQMSGQFVALTDVVLPGEEVDVSVQFKAPSEAGTYLSAWQMRNPAGVTFEEIIFVKILVQ
jgi:Ig-like domain-containing protein